MLVAPAGYYGPIWKDRIGEWKQSCKVCWPISWKGAEIRIELMANSGNDRSSLSRRIDQP